LAAKSKISIFFEFILGRRSMSNSIKTYDVIYAGNYTKDTIITPDGVRNVDGGGMNYAANAGARLGIRAAVITVLAKEDQHVVDAIQRSGIDCYPIYSPNSTLMTLEYKTNDVDKRNLYVKSTAGTIKPEYLDGLQAKAIAVSPSLRGEVEPVFFSTLRNKTQSMLAVDVQGFVRVLRHETLVYEPWPEMPDVLRNLDILKSDAVEAEFLTGEKNIEKAAVVFASYGVKEIVLTHSEGVLIYADGQHHHFQFYAKSMEGRSGRGDTCMGSYVAKRLNQSPREAGKWAAATTSLKLERHGVFNRPISEVKEFIKQFYPD
jgi:sugar/nucleoside kinase (ribokinase family)